MLHNEKYNLLKASRLCFLKFHKRQISIISKDYYHIIFLMKNSSIKYKNTKLILTLEQHFKEKFNLVRT
jgi:hypothetical protein